MALDSLGGNIRFARFPPPALEKKTPSCAPPQILNYLLLPGIQPTEETGSFVRLSDPSTGVYTVQSPFLGFEMVAWRLIGGKQVCQTAPTWRAERERLTVSSPLP